MVAPGDDLATFIVQALTAMERPLQSGDVLVVTSKVVSKAEGRLVALDSVQPGEYAQALADETRKDPRLVELVLQESRDISRKAPHVLVVEHRLGFVSANAGIDQSNIEDGDNYALLLPANPDASATALRDALHQKTGVAPGVVISDSHGRPFRLGNVGVAVGVAGLPALRDLRGQHDLYGRPLKISLQGYADLIASAAALLSGEGDEGRPVILLRGLHPATGAGQATDLYRDKETDLYR